jgi:hypothetical protein
MPEAVWSRQNDFHWPRISIITVNYNQARWLPGCLDSIHSQHYPALEHIVIDGGSKDDSTEIIRSHSAKLAYWCSEPDQGQYDALNKGFARSTGEIMGFLNADDVYLPWTLRTVASIFQALPQVEWIVSTQATQVSADGAAFASGPVVPPSRNAFLDGLYVPGGAASVGCIVQEGVFWRRSLWERAGARLNLERGLGADFDLWCQFFCQAEPYALSVPLAAMTRQPQQRSNNSTRYREECEASLAALQRNLNHRPRRLGLKHGVIHLPVFRSLAWRVAKRFFDYEVKSVHAEMDSSGYQTGWATKSFRLIL